MPRFELELSPHPKSVSFAILRWDLEPQTETHMDQIRRKPNANEPERWFATPHEILASTELTRGQKYLALDRWKTVVEVRLRKSRSASPEDVALHQAIIRARRVMNSPSSWLSPARRPAQFVD